MPSSADLHMLVGAELAAINLAPYSVQFSFDDCLLTVEYKIEHVGVDGQTYGYDCVAKHGSPLLLHRLLSIPIVAVEREDLSFTGRFADGQLLVIYTEVGPYECGQLSWGSNGANLLVF